MVFALRRQNINPGKPDMFRSYQFALNSAPNCTIWEAMYATMAHPILFKSIEIREQSTQYSFVGEDFGCSPIVPVLAEVTRLHPNRHVASILSIGPGNTSTIQISGRSRSPSFLSIRSSTDMRDAVTESEQVAEAMAARFQDVNGLYYRFNVKQGLQDIDVADWEKLGEVMVHTKNYMERADTSGMMDQAAEAIQGRRAAISVEYIGK